MCVRSVNSIGCSFLLSNIWWKNFFEEESKAIEESNILNSFTDHHKIPQKQTNPNTSFNQFKFIWLKWEKISKTSFETKFELITLNKVPPYATIPKTNIKLIHFSFLSFVSQLMLVWSVIQKRKYCIIEQSLPFYLFLREKKKIRSTLKAINNIITLNGQIM